MKVNITAKANATGAVFAILYLFCAAAVAFFPDLSMTIAQSWFHGIKLARISDWTVTFPSFILGLVTSAVGGWLIGYLWASLYNRFAKK